MKTAFCALVALASLLPVDAWAQLARRGALLLQEDFQRHATYTKERLPVQPGWKVRVAHGLWSRTPDGVRSTWEKGHSPVLVYEGEFNDVIIEVDFRFQAVPGQWAACRVSATNPVLFPRGYAASVWANVDFKSRGRGFLIENDVWDGPITRVAYKKADYVPDTWYTLRLELVGNQAVAECNGIRATGTHDMFGIPKTTIWLATGQSPYDLRNLRVYAAERNPDGAQKAETKP